jgi:hypothetical protein
MNKKSRRLLYLSAFILTLFVVELLYLQSTHAMSQSAKEKKIAFVELVGLPDLALSNENYASRHRSLSGVFESYADDGALREYSYSSFSMSHSTMQNPKRVTDEK